MTTETWGGELSALESRADIDSLEDLHSRRRQILPEYAGLKALHGPFGKWDNKRKAMLEAMKIRARMVCEAAQKKATDAMVDAMAHGDDQYVAFVDEGIVSATRYVELETSVTEIEERIRNREFSILAYNSEIKLGR